MTKTKTESAGLTRTTAGLTRTIAVINGKGGTFKTSISAAVAGLLAASGSRVLVVDLDPQGNLCEQFGLAETTDGGAQLANNVPSGRAVVPAPTGRDRLEILFGGDFLEDLDATMRGRQGRDRVWMHALANSLEESAYDYDIIILDCPPGFPVLQTLALVAARYVLIPTKSDAMSRKGLRKIANLFTAVRPHNPELELLGVVRTGTTTAAHAIRDQVRAEVEEDLGGAAPVLESYVRHVEGAAKAGTDTGRLPHELEPELENQKPWYLQIREGKVARGLPRSTSGLAQDYAELTAEIIDLLVAAETREEVSA